MDVLSEMDNFVGVFVDELEERDLLENTIVVFTSDNGGMNALNTGIIRVVNSEIIRGRHMKTVTKFHLSCA